MIKLKTWGQKALGYHDHFFSRYQAFLIAKLVPRLSRFTRTKPINIFLATLVLGLATALTYFFATYLPSLYLLAILLMLSRMAFETLGDLVIAKHSTSTAFLANIQRITPELFDMLILIGIAMADSDYTILGLIAVCSCWATTFIQMITTSPVPLKNILITQRYRYSILLIMAFLQCFSQELHLHIDFIYLFLIGLTLLQLRTIFHYYFKEMSHIPPSHKK
jgi:hypothetical protein